jgi:uncharacterized protein YyaL (SSP411 family)
VRINTIVCMLFLMAPIACSNGQDEDLTDKTTEHKQNKLAGENSPYLLQHADNPVEWYPWGEEALSRAKAEDKPIFLSIGYSSCHWCHVMEHESFEDPEIAALMNKYFVNIKVDREQRPDLDEIYMSFTTSMTGQGGWPMSVFLTPDLKPFYAGTYFPPEDRYGRPGFAGVITQLGEAYRSQKTDVINTAENIFDAMKQQLGTSVRSIDLDKNSLKQAAEQLYSNFDNVNGGFGNQPKFPHPIELSLFLRHYKRSGNDLYLKAAELALKNMARGGIYDQIGGGFHRYATDSKWLIPHFEKMLYDNALLIPVYAEAYQITKDTFYLSVITETLDFILRELADKTGGFYSALDADSEGEEGKFYIWSINEIKNFLGGDAEQFIKHFNVTDGGNFEGHNILNVTASSESVTFSKDSKKILLEKRAERIRPLTDDKILTSWNGLAISAFCRGYQVTGESRFLEAAIKCASFIKNVLFKDNKLTHSYREGKHSSGEFLEDYSFLIRGLIDLYESDRITNNNEWIEFAQSLTDNALELFAGEDGRFYLRPDNQKDLLFRPQEERDGAIPSAGSVMLGNLLQLNRITDEKKYYTTAVNGFNALSGIISEYPAGMSSAILALDFYFENKIEIVLTGQGDTLNQMLDAIYRSHIPNRIIAFDIAGNSALSLFEGRQSKDGEVRAFFCVNSVCKLPVKTVTALVEQLDSF